MHLNTPVTSQIIITKFASKLHLLIKMNPFHFEITLAHFDEGVIVNLKHPKDVQLKTPYKREGKLIIPLF